MEWDSPWGLGFPGWHIECSAMSMKYLGESFDIHVGGEDLRQTHHPNEIAQSEAATDKTFVKYWLHATFLQVDGKKMSKSLGNVYTVADIESKGYDPLALKYLFLTSHYRDSLNFTWTALDSAQKSLNKLYQLVRAAKSQGSRTVLSQDKRKKVDDFQLTFLKDINDDLNTPRALAKLWSALKSNIPSEDKYDMAVLFDQIFGLKLADAAAYSDVVPKEVIKLVLQREDLRKSNKYKDADAIRKKLTELGYEVKDTKEGSKVNKLDKI
jgi:cysteinyl-tRNA synthetase